MTRRVAYRIVDKDFVDSAFTGEGAALYPGRWNRRGELAVYAAQSLSLAMLETLVSLEYVEELEKHWRYFEIWCDSFPIGIVPPKSWPTTPIDETRAIGSSLLQITSRGLQSVWFRVPSIVVPGEVNYVLNPLNPKFRRMVKISGPFRLEFDKRLLAVLRNSKNPEG